MVSVPVANHVARSVAFNLAFDTFDCDRSNHGSLRPCCALGGEPTARADYRQFQPQVIAGGITQILPDTYIAFGGEDGGVSERKLNLFERGAPFMGQLQTCVSEEEPFPGARTGTILPAFPPYRHAGSKEKSPIHFHRHFPEFMVMAWCLDENPGFLRTYPGFHLSAYQHMGVTD